MAVRIEGLFFYREIHPGEACARDPLLSARRAGAVEAHVGMMEDAGIPRSHLDGLHPARGRDGNGKNKIPEYFLSVGGELVRLRDMQHQVGRAELPLILELGRLRGASRGP